MIKPVASKMCVVRKLYILSKIRVKPSVLLY